MKPKYKIGQKIVATWASGRESIHTIVDVKYTEHGFWYSWTEDDGFKQGLHEKYLSTYYPIKK